VWGVANIRLQVAVNCAKEWPGRALTLSKRDPAPSPQPTS